MQATNLLVVVQGKPHVPDLTLLVLESVQHPDTFLVVFDFGRVMMAARSPAHYTVLTGLQTLRFLVKMHTNTDLLCLQYALQFSQDYKYLLCILPVLFPYNCNL